jgi:hypothetical protein
MADYAPQERTLYVAYTNTDLSEGRGRDVPIAVCELEVTAKRLAALRYVQGTDGPVRPVTMLRYQGKWYIPAGVVAVVPPTEDDIAYEAHMAARQQVLERARAAGLTEDDLAIIQASYKTRNS